MKLKIEVSDAKPGKKSNVTDFIESNEININQVFISGINEFTGC